MKTKLNVQHDYVTLSVTDANKRKLNLTWSRRGQTGSSTSGKGAFPYSLKDAVSAFAAYPTLKTIGETMATLRQLAEEAPDFDAFVAGMEGAKLPAGKVVVPKPKRGALARGRDPRAGLPRERFTLRRVGDHDELFDTQTGRHVAVPLFALREVIKALDALFGGAS